MRLAQMHAGAHAQGCTQHASMEMKFCNGSAKDKRRARAYVLHMRATRNSHGTFEGELQKMTLQLPPAPLLVEKSGNRMVSQSASSQPANQSTPNAVAQKQSLDRSTWVKTTTQISKEMRGS